MQRKINVYLIHESNQFRLRLIQIQKEERHRGRVDGGLRYLLGFSSCISESVFQHLAVFNGIETNDQNARDLYFNYRRHYKSEIIEDAYHNNSEFVYNVLDLDLPTNITQLLMILGTLDGTLNSYVYVHGQKNGVTSLSYCNDLPDFSRKFDICHETYAAESKRYIKPDLSLSHRVAKWMVDELSKNEAELTDNQALINYLNELLAIEDASLTRTIREKLYPDPSIDAFLDKHLKPEDLLMREMLDPKIHHQPTTEKLIDFLKFWLRKKDNKPHVDKTTMHPIHIEITAWFKKFEELRHNLWHETIKRLYGKPAVDGGFYGSNYTEVNLLRDAKIKLNQNGLMELFILDTESYNENYAPGERLYDVLEEELRKACAMLDLEFLPKQDFHKRIIFTPESSLLLKNHGFQYSEDYCKKLLQSSHHIRVFNCADFGNQPNLFRRLPRDMKTLLLGWIQIANASENDKDVKKLKV